MIPDNNAASLRCVRLCLINSLAFLSFPQDVLTSRGNTDFYRRGGGATTQPMPGAICCTPN